MSLWAKPSAELRQEIEIQKRLRAQNLRSGDAEQAKKRRKLIRALKHELAVRR